MPKGTYAPGNKVLMVVNEDVVSITDCLTGEIYASHPLCHEKGKLIGQKREYRDKSKNIQEQEILLRELFLHDELVMPFLEHIHEEKPRHYRDQLGVIRRLFEEWNTEMLIEGLHYCSERELYSAGDLKSTVIYFQQLKTDKNIKKLPSTLPTKYLGNKPQVRDLRIYEDAMERGVVNG